MTDNRLEMSGLVVSGLVADSRLVMGLVMSLVDGLMMHRLVMRGSKVCGLVVNRFVMGGGVVCGLVVNGLVMRSGMVLSVVMGIRASGVVLLMTLVR